VKRENRNWGGGAVGVGIGVKAIKMKARERQPSGACALAIYPVSRYYLDMLRFDWDERRNISARKATRKEARVYEEGI